MSSDEDCSDSESDSESDSDLSWLSMPPITSDDEFSDSSNTDVISGSSDEEELLHSGQSPYVPTTAESCPAASETSGSQDSESRGSDDHNYDNEIIL